MERRRRDNINEKIQELAMLLPEEWLEPSSAGGKGSSGAFGGASLAGLLSGTVSGSALGSGGAIAMDEDTKEVKANKGVILRNSVEYIKYGILYLISILYTNYFSTGISSSWSRSRETVTNNLNLSWLSIVIGSEMLSGPRMVSNSSLRHQFVIFFLWSYWHGTSIADI